MSSPRVLKSRWHVSVCFELIIFKRKVATHKKRSGKASASIEIKETNLCLTDRKTFLSNYVQKLSLNECPCDANTTIVEVAHDYSKEQPVIVYADDTDILSLLIHRYHNTSDLKDIFLIEMTKNQTISNANAIQSGKLSASF